MRRVAAAVVLVTAAAALSGCQSGRGPTERDIRAEERASFPGAVEKNRSFSREQRAKGIDGNDLSVEAHLIREFTLPAPVQATEVFSWYEERFVAVGWTRQSRSGTTLTVTLRVSDREHRFSVTVGQSGPVTSFSTAYWIGFSSR